ncbi:MAG: phosphate acyltransferase PlsX [Rhodospirillales bacterium]
MSNRLTLSLDAMGGDNSPNMVIAGVNTALKQMPDVNYLLFGDREKINPVLEKFPRVAEVSRIHHTDEVVTNDTQPAIALRAGRNSSMRLAINAVANGEADGIVSAGNTGALMAMAKFVLKTLPGIDRPAIAASLPTQRGETVMLDLGANVICTANHLVQFAVMGEVFARNVLGKGEPSIGILNIGVEGVKGNEAVKKAAAILQESSLPIRFYGFVEGDDIGAGTVDIIVTDGFTGNVALKTIEGTAKMYTFFLKQALLDSLPARFGALLARPALTKLRAHLDPRRYNGAMLLGLNGICVKSHGGTDAFGFANAIRVAVQLITEGVNEDIKKDYGKLGEVMAQEQHHVVANG